MKKISDRYGKKRKYNLDNDTVTTVLRKSDPALRLHISLFER